MVQINFAQKQVNAKIVYYGPGMSGKTTNLEIIHQRAPKANRGELTSISTDGDRTLFFDFMPLDLGTVAGMRTCFQIYTVPGQVYYNSTRKLVLQGVDGVIFVADSSASMLEENLESMRNLDANLAEYGRSLAELPLVIQYNKRDLPDAMPVEELDQSLNPGGVPAFEGIAHTGQGVFPTLKALAASVIENIHSQHRGGGHVSSAVPAAQRPASQPQPAAGEAPAAHATAPSPQRAPAAAPAEAGPAGGGGAAEPQPAIPAASAGAQAGATEGPKLRLASSHKEGAPPAGTATRPALRTRTSMPTAEQPQPVRRPVGGNGLKRSDGTASMKLAAKRSSAPPPARQAPAGAGQKRPAGAAQRKKAAASGSPRRAPRPTPVQKKGNRSALVTGIIVAASVGIGAVLGSFVLSVL